MIMKFSRPILAVALLAATAACTQLSAEDRALIDQSRADSQRAAESATRAERAAQAASEAAQRAASDARAASERAERMFQRTQRKAAGS